MSLQALKSFQWPSRLLFLRAVLVLIGGFLVHISLGTIYTFGNIAPYIVSYIRNQSHPANLKQATTTWIFACALIGQGGSMFLGGILVKKIGPRWTTLIGSWLMSFGVVMSYFAIKVSFWLLLVTYGLVFGVGVGIAYIGPLSSAMNWFPKWKGLVNGMVVAGFGIGALIFNSVQTTYINPQNCKVVEDDNGEKYFIDSDLLERVPSVFIILGVTYAAMQLVGSLLITNPPDEYFMVKSDESADFYKSGQYREVDDNSVAVKDKNKEGSSSSVPVSRSSPERSPSRMSNFSNPENEKLSEERIKLLHQGINSINYTDSERSRSSTPDVGDEEKTASNRSLSRKKDNVVASLKPLQMLKKPSFYMLWVMFLLGGFSTINIATLYKFFGQDFINDDHFLAGVGSVAAIFNWLGRIIWGILADRVSYKFALVVLSGTMTVFVLTFYATIMGGKVMYTIWVCIIFFCIGGNFSLFPTAIGRAFGLKFVPMNYGLLFTSQIVAGSMGALLSTFLKSYLHFYGIFFLVSGCNLVFFILAMMYRPKRYFSLQHDQ